jgi:hypothetical protein
MAKNRVGDIAEDLILVAVVLGGGYLLVKNLPNMFGGLLSSGNVNANQQALADTQAKAATASLAASTAAGVQQSISANQAATAAQNIYDTFNGSSIDTTNMSTAYNSINICANETDWNALVVAFGTKSFNPSGSFMCSAFGTGCESLNLPAAIQAAISVEGQDDPVSAQMWVNEFNALWQSIGVGQTVFLTQ